MAVGAERESGWVGLEEDLHQHGAVGFGRSGPGESGGRTDRRVV